MAIVYDGTIELEPGADGKATMHVAGYPLAHILAIAKPGDYFSLAIQERDPSHMPPPPLRPKLSWHESIRVKRLSPVAAGGWAAGIALAVELARVVLEHWR